jgi:hypothetical protein
MSTLIKTTEDGRKVEVLDRAIFFDGKQETTALVEVREHPNRTAILQAVPNATHMAGRIPLTAEQAAIARAALDQANEAYEFSPAGIAERQRLALKNVMSKLD